MLTARLTEAVSAAISSALQEQSLSSSFVVRRLKMLVLWF